MLFLRNDANQQKDHLKLENEWHHIDANQRPTLTYRPSWKDVMTSSGEDENCKS